MTFILVDAWLITMNERREVLEGASVWVEQDRIAAVGTSEALKERFPEAEIVDCKGRIVMPGKFVALMQKGFHQDATIMTAEKVLEMATIDGPRGCGFGSANRFHLNREKSGLDRHRL